MMKNKRIGNWFIGIILIVVLMIIFNSTDKKPFQTTINTIMTPFGRFFSGGGHWFSQKIKLFSNIGNLKEENEELTNENLKLKFKLISLRDVKQENDILREQLKLKPKNNFEIEASFILGQAFSKNRRVIYLDKGTKNGIESGMPVIVGDGILIGRISKVYRSNSEVELIVDKNININAEIQEIKTKGIVKGEYGTSAIMDLIPQAAKVEKGQTIITSGLGGSFPRGLLIGYVEDTGLTVDKLFQRALLELPVQLRDLRTVWVVKGFESEN